MDSSIMIRVFDWKGELWMGVDRVTGGTGRRYAPRARLATYHAKPMRDVPEDVALLWMLECLTAWVNAGCPKRWAADPEGIPAPPGGGHGGRRVATRNGAPAAVTSQTAPGSVDHSGAEGVSDGLVPPGRTDPLF